MKKPKKKRIKDENEMAYDVISRTIKSSETKPLVDPAVSAAAKALSALGASKGGKARANKLNPDRRKQIAKQAAAARWHKSKQSPKNH